MADDPFDLLDSPHTGRAKVQYLREFTKKNVHYDKKLKAEAQRRLENIEGTEEHTASESARVDREMALQQQQLAEYEQSAKGRDEKRKKEAGGLVSMPTEDQPKPKKRKRRRGSRKTKKDTDIFGNVKKSAYSFGVQFGPTELPNDPMLALSRFLAGDWSAMPKPATIPSFWVARVLAVKMNALPEQKDFSKVARPYEVYARRIKPSGDLYDDLPTIFGIKEEVPNRDLLLVDPCKVGSNLKGDDLKNAIYSHPKYFPVPTDLRIPTPGDLINVYIEPGTDEGNYTGFLVNRPLPASIEDFRTPQSTEAAMKTLIPIKKPTPQAKCADATGTVSNEEILKLQNIKLKKGGYLKLKQQLEGTDPNHKGKKIPDSAKRFLKALDEELSKVGSTIRVNTPFRNDIVQVLGMYKNWYNTGDHNADGTANIADKDAYLQMYGSWGKKDLGRLIEIYHVWHAAGIDNKTVWKSGVAKQYKDEAIAIASRHRSGHSTGHNIDIMFGRGNQATLNWRAMKAAARRTCALIQIERDHWHVVTNKGKWGWMSIGGSAKVNLVWRESLRGGEFGRGARSGRRKPKAKPKAPKSNPVLPCDPVITSCPQGAPTPPASTPAPILHSAVRTQGSRVEHGYPYDSSGAVVDPNSPLGKDICKHFGGCG